ncbi:hypothetical protein O181_063198 [Austropuccinia psidii MF-1]|uniref:Uncharacterized protein n=1 Tax=Austropuccinia psidii MF-1 TaxID=1389203 RepID=A0A9Q3ER64_9BASI|nr:hypothetical protein [Austropuccinia psidii MF-1]
MMIQSLSLAILGGKRTRWGVLGEFESVSGDFLSSSPFDRPSLPSIGSLADRNDRNSAFVGEMALENLCRLGTLESLIASKDIPTEQV